MQNLIGINLIFLTNFHFKRDPISRSGKGQKEFINNVDIEYVGYDSNLPESTKTLYPDLIELPTIAE